MESKVLLRFAAVLVVSFQVMSIVHLRRAEAALSCGDAVSGMAPCGSYLVGAGETKPSSSCCSAVRWLKAKANTAELRRSLCECLKRTVPSFGVKPERARALPSQCQVHVQIDVSPNIDCSKLG